MSELLHRRRPTPPVRIVHLGLGAFHRAHQAAYTDAADVEREWGIAAFTGRTPDAATILAAQDGVFTLIERGPEADLVEQVESIVEAHDGADRDSLRALVAAPTTAVITLTVTESAYCLTAERELDGALPAIAADVEALRTAGQPVTMPGRLVDALRARLDAGAGPIAVVSCDNLPGNGEAARAAVLGLAALVEAGLSDRIAAATSFVSTSVDRITPRTTPADIAALREMTGVIDAAPVVTEPYSSWILSGDFPAGRPQWERAGAQFVDDIVPFEQRKLWLLNGAHSLLAYEGILRGHETVESALADPTLLSAVEALWNETASHLSGVGLDIPQYRAALLARFRNGRIAHHLKQIAADGAVKLRARAVPVIRAERRAGRSGTAAARMIAVWIEYVRSLEDASQVADAEREAIVAAAASTAPVDALVALIDRDLATDPVVLDAIHLHLSDTKSRSLQKSDQ